MHYEILSPARHKLSVHQPAIRLLTFSLPLGTVMQLSSFAMKRYLFLSVLLLLLISWFYFCCFVFYCLPEGKDFCSNSDLAPKCLKPACRIYKFAVSCSFSLNVDWMQYFVKFSFSFQSQPDRSAFLWLPNFALTFRVTTLLPFVSEPATLLGTMSTA